MRAAPLKAMLVDSWYDPYLGVVILVRVIDGVIKKGLQVKFMAGGTEHLIDRVGCFTPKIEQLPELGPGEIGFITAQIKEVAQARVGDTITTVKNGATKALPGFKEVQPVVFCGMFPVDAADLKSCAKALAACASTMPASASRWNRARRWASASAAASSACCTWRSFRSA
jgi:GTP-binding protein LepA